VTPDPDTLKHMFRRAPFVAELGMELESLGDGVCATFEQWTKQEHAR
jgi:acyl-coenzyme A thioesterase PaaI-like protein